MSDSDKGDRIKESKELDKEAQDLQQMLKEVKKDTCLYIFACLKVAIREQQSIKQISKDTGNYLLEFVRQECIRKGWMD